MDNNTLPLSKYLQITMIIKKIINSASLAFILNKTNKFHHIYCYHQNFKMSSSSSSSSNYNSIISILETHLRQTDSLLSNRKIDWNSDDEEEEQLFPDLIKNTGTDKAMMSEDHNKNDDDAKFIPFKITLVKAPMLSASIRSIHFENFQIRQLFSKLKIVSRIVANVLEELRLSIVHLDSSSEDDENDDACEGNNNNNNKSNSSTFNSKDWMKSVSIGGFVPPVALYRTSLAIPSYVQALPPKMELAPHCFLQVQFDYDEQDNHHQVDGKQETQRVAAHLSCLVAFVAIQVGLSKTVVIALVESCMKNAFLGKSRGCSASASSSSTRKIPSLVFVAPNFEDLIEKVYHSEEDLGGEENGNGNATTTITERNLFITEQAPTSPLLKKKYFEESSLSSSSSIESDIFDTVVEKILDILASTTTTTAAKNDSDVVISPSSICSFVSSAFTSFLTSNNPQSLKRFDIKRENERVGAFGNFFEITQAREALRYLSIPLEKDLLSESTNNSVQVDLFDTYMAAAVASHQSSSSSSSSSSIIIKIPKSPFFALPSVLQRKLSKKSKIKELSNGVQKIVENKNNNTNGNAVIKAEEDPILSAVFASPSSNTASSMHHHHSHESGIGRVGSLFNKELYSLIFNCLEQTHDLKLRSQRLKMELVFGESLQKGIPPSLRLSVWAALLEIDEEEIDTESRREEAKFIAFSASPCDRQLLLDLPRCHPSDPLMKTPDGQAAAQRIVRLWLHYATKKEEDHHQNDGNNNKNHGTKRKQHHIHYWQGIDSMAATMLSAGKSELMAAHVMEKMIEKFVPEYAASDAIRARVGRLAGIVRFHDPFAAAHLDEACGVQIDHFALPWILTAFAHVFPLSQTCRLWDALLLHPESVTLLLNFTVAVITASRLHFLNAPDLASSLLLLRQSAQNVVASFPLVAVDANASPSTNNHLVLFTNVLDSARKYASVSPPYYSGWDDLDRENCLDTMKKATGDSKEKRRKRSMIKKAGRYYFSSDDDDENKEQQEQPKNNTSLSSFDKLNDLIDDGFHHNNDNDDADADENDLMMMMGEELPVKRHVASVQLRDIEDYDSCRWKNVIVVLVQRNLNKIDEHRQRLIERKKKEQDEIEKKLVFVVGPRVQFLVGDDEEYSQAQSISSIRSFIRKQSESVRKSAKGKSIPDALKSSPVTQEETSVAPSSSISSRYIVVVVSAKKHRAIEAALQLAGEGLEHVATLDL